VKLDVESILTGLRAARREAIMSWSPDYNPEEGVHLLNALTDIELSVIALERHEESEAAAARHAAERPVEQ
jgi:hypothetical protein